MSILVDQSTRLLVQGITGNEGGRATGYMLEYGTIVTAGVSPGKGGGRTAHNIPVYDTVQEAKQQHPDINASFIVVPAPFVKDAALEAMYAGILFVTILTEHIPIHDTADIIAHARRVGACVVGPSSVGVISPRKAKVGSIGSGDIADRVFAPGHIGVISKSGGMTAEISRILTDAGMGQSTAIGIGGEVLIGSAFTDLALLFEEDDDTHALVIFGEVGGVYEEQLAEAMQAGKITKPVVTLIAGDFGNALPKGTVLGHAGAIVNRGKGSAASKKQALQKAGAYIADTPEDIPSLISHALTYEYQHAH